MYNILRMVIKLNIVRHKEHPVAPKKKTTLIIERVTSSSVSRQKPAAKKKKALAPVRKIQKTKPEVHEKKMRRSLPKKAYSSLVVGDSFPQFSLPSSDGGVVSLESLRGEKFVLYFYPKDMTSGCATEAREFSLLADEFAHLGYRIFGVSSDTIDRHLKFIAKENITFPLLSDESKVLARACGILRPGILRTTYVVDAQGHIEYLYEKVSAKGHSACVYKDISTQKTST